MVNLTTASALPWHIAGNGKTPPLSPPPLPYFLFLWKQAWGVYLCSCPTPATRNWPELENFRLLMNPGWKEAQADVRKKKKTHARDASRARVARFDAHQRHAEQRLQAAIIQLALPHLHLWVVRTCGGNEETRFNQARTRRRRQPLDQTPLIASGKRRCSRGGRSQPEAPEATVSEFCSAATEDTQWGCSSPASPWQPWACFTVVRGFFLLTLQRHTELRTFTGSGGAGEGGEETWVNSKSSAGLEVPRLEEAVECLTRRRLPWSNAPR